MKLFKWILGVLALILVVVAAFASYTISKGSDKLASTYPLDYDDAMVVSDSASLALGKYLAESHGCQGCHAADYSGSILVDAPPFLVVPTNLTSGKGGIGSTFTDADWLRAIRHGVRPDGSGLIVMPSEAYYYMNDEEVGALVAYLKSIPAVDNELPKTEFRMLGKFILGISEEIKMSPDMMLGTPRVAKTEKGPTAAWGEYRASVICQVCHAPGLTGGQPPDPDSPFAPDLRVTQSWGLDGFMKALREGVTPSGRAIDDKFMPWSDLGNLDDVEIEAIYAYISTL